MGVTPEKMKAEEKTQPEKIAYRQYIRYSFTMSDRKEQFVKMR